MPARIDREPKDPLEPDKLDPAVLHDDTNYASGKIAVFQYIAVGVFLFLIAGFWKLQVQNNELYSEAAERNRIKSTPFWRRGERFWTAKAER